MQSHQSCFIPWPTVSEWHPFLCQTVTSIMFHHMTNRQWVTLLYFFARQSHQSCLSHDHQAVSKSALFLCQVVSSILLIPWLTVCEWHCFISLPGSLINHLSSHDQQRVSETPSFICQVVLSIMFCPMTNRQWVTLLYFFAGQSHQLCFILWPTGSEWHCFTSLPGSLINHVSSHDQQLVSDTPAFICQAVSSIMLHPMTNRKWVTLLYSLPGSLINHVLFHDQQEVSDTAIFLCHAVSSIMFIPWATGSEWYYFISWPGNLTNHVSSPGQQAVSDTALFLCQAVSSIICHPMTNRQWVTLLLYFFAR